MPAPPIPLAHANDSATPDDLRPAHHHPMRWLRREARRLSRPVEAFWQRHRSVLMVAAANTFVGAAVAFAAAMLGLVVERLFPSPDHHGFPTPQTIILVLSIGLLFAATLLRSRTHRSTGTLFYVRILDERMRDWHSVPLQAARRRRMSLRSLTRWVDLPARTSGTGVIDLTNVCEQVAASLELLVNTDRDDTGYTIAPNLPWPAALAIGVQLPLVEDLDLLELPGTQSGPSDRSPEVTLRLCPGDLTGRTGVIHRGPPGCLRGQRTGTGRVGLILAFTPAGRPEIMDPEQMFGGLGVSDYHRLSPCLLHAASPCATGEDLTGLEDIKYTSKQLTALAEALPAEVLRIKREAGTRELVVAAAVPKTLALALGWGLVRYRDPSRQNCRFFAGTHLLYKPAGEALTPMRVHPAQPTCPTGPTGN